MILALVLAAFLILAELLLWQFYQQFSWELFLLFGLAAGSVWGICFWYFRRQNKIMEEAVSRSMPILTEKSAPGLTVITKVSYTGCFILSIRWPQSSMPMRPMNCGKKNF